ncbi:MAG: amidohydrolase [Planctomycetes bacterium]|nr:amidohydrolase [Planctomycetota bacterium]
MQVVDFHSHFFSRAYFETLAAQSPQAGSVEEKLAALAKRTGMELPGASVEAHLARWIAELDRYKVEHLCTFASVPEELPAVIEAAALSNGRVSAFALVNPRVEGVAAKVRGLLVEKRIRGVLLFPALHHYRIDGPEAGPLCAVLAEQRAIAYVHCGLLVVKVRDLLGLPRTVDLRHADPLHVIPAANAHPDARFVIPHFGAGYFREALFAGAQCPNVFVDTSSSNGWIATQSPKPTLMQVFERALEVFGPTRVLFGTDSTTFPAGWRRDRWEEQHRVLTEIGASAADQELVFRGNARRLLGLG